MRPDTQPPTTRRAAPPTGRAWSPGRAHPPSRWLFLLFALIVVLAPISNRGVSPQTSDGVKDVGQVEATAVVPMASPARATPSLLPSNNRLAKSFPWLLVALLFAVAAVADCTKRRTHTRDRRRRPALTSHRLPLRRGPPLTPA